MDSFQSNSHTWTLFKVKLTNDHHNDGDNYDDDDNAPLTQLTCEV